MQNEHNAEAEEVYDPDDWGAPLPSRKCGAAPSPSALPVDGPRPTEPDGRRGESSPVRKVEGLSPATPSCDAPRDAGSAPSTEPKKLRRGPARMVAPAPGIALPHASKLDLFPAVFSRSALFRVSGSDDPAEPAQPGAVPISIDAQGGVHLTLLGPWPRMRDKAVWEIALEMAKESANPARPMPVNLSEFASRLGYSDKGGQTLEWIWASLRRLSFCHVALDSPASSGPRLTGNLLLAARESARRKEIEVDSTFASRLLGEDFQFAINRTRRAMLSTALAQWLHDFLSTHSTQGRPFDLPYLRSLCGYGLDHRRFPADLEKALAHLAVKAPEILASYSFEKGSRSSDGWSVALVCGPEKRRFEQPKPAPKPSAAPRPSGRGGVAL